VTAEAPGRSGRRPDEPGPAPVLTTRRLLLTIPSPEAAPLYLTYAIENDPHLAPWEPPRPRGYFTEGYWYRRLEQNRDELAAGRSLRLGIFRRDDAVAGASAVLLGHCNFNQIVRGGFQAAVLGYSLDRRCEGRGMMTEALSAALPFVFDRLGLHRVMANYVPTNERSGRVLRRLGFVVEGYARDYLYIGGAWRDHVLTSLTSPSPRPPTQVER
jgi:ribosomal-protein-alanine N-acetyltransferase